MELPRPFVARREEVAGFAAHLTVRVDGDVPEIARRQVLVFAPESARVVREELQRAIVAGLDVERAARVRETVLAVVHFGEVDEELRPHRPLLRRDVFTGQAIRSMIDDAIS